MSPLARPLLALAAAALLHAACGQIRDQCSSVTHGIQRGQAFPLHETYVEQGVQDAYVDIPYACPPGLRMVGEQVTACDDAPPLVTLPDWPQYTPAKIHRTGAYWAGRCSVQVTQWCD